MTAGQLSFHPEAIDEAEAAAQWYRERSPQAAAQFVAELFDVFEKIHAAPQRWPRGARGTRKAKLPCFPFVVIYRELTDGVQILAVAHGRRRPGYWKKRR